MNVAHIVLVIAFLESSLGRNFNHPDPHNHGWTGISDIAIKDLNNRAGYEKYKATNMNNREMCFRASVEHINNYLETHADWSLTDILLFWRCGIGGMNRPTPKQLEYMQNGVERYSKLINGDPRWKE